jgi:hypothetical protein
MCLASTGDGELHSLRADVRKAKMILTGNQIKQAVRDGDITISSFSDDFVESNSYGFHLGKELAVYTETPIDAYGLRPVDCIQIPDGGYVLRPNFFLDIRWSRWAAGFTRPSSMRGCRPASAGCSFRQARRLVILAQSSLGRWKSSSLILSAFTRAC